MRRGLWTTIPAMKPGALRYPRTLGFVGGPLTSAEEIVGISAQKSATGWSIVTKPSIMFAGVAGAVIAVMIPKKGKMGDEERGVFGNIGAAALGFLFGGAIVVAVRAGEHYGVEG